MASNGTKYTQEQVIGAIRANKGLIYATARSLNCSPATIYNYIKRYKAVAQAAEEERGLFVDKAESALYDAVEKGEGWAISLTLKTLGKSRGYVERWEHTGDDGGPVKFVVTFARGQDDSEND